MVLILNVDLKKDFAFYSAYHKNPVNKIIHGITIPLIVWTIFVFLSYTTFYTYDDSTFGKWFGFNFNIVLLILYLGFYIMLDLIAGLVMIPISISLYLLANGFRFFVPYAYVYTIVLFVIAWILQFAGHKFWEGNRPALFDSFKQAFLMAPLFVLMEAMFYFGYNKELQQDIKDLEQQFSPLV